MILSINSSRKILGQLQNSRYQRAWHGLFTLMMIFILGYIGSIIFLLTNNVGLLTRSVGVIYLLGSIFVYLVTQVGYLTIHELHTLLQTNQQSEKEIEKQTTELTNINEELQVRTAQFEAIFRSLPDTIIFSDMERRILLTNPALTHMFGYTFAEVANHSTKILYESEETYQKHRAERHTLSLEERVKPFELMRRRKNGEVFPSETVRVEVKNANGEPIGILGIVRDITERKNSENSLRQLNAELEMRVAARTQELLTSNEQLRLAIAEHQRIEEALRISEQSFRHLAFNSPDTIFVYDLSTHSFTFMNRDVFLGYSQTELQQPNSVLHAVHPNDAPMVQSVWQDWETGKLSPPKIVEYRVKHKDGRWEWVQTRVTVLVYDESKQPQQLLTTLTIITERKQTEQQLAQQALALARTNRELRQIAYVAAHDLREPLRKVRSYTELLSQKYETQLDDKADSYMHYIIEGATRMYMLVSDILSYLNLEQESLTMNPTDIEAIVRLVLKELKQEIANNHINITHDHLPTIMANASQLIPLWHNLLSNAIKFRRPNDPRIHISAKMTDESWLFSVEDNGLGFDPDYADRVFGMFQRLHGNSDYPGTGIGLAICRKVVENHNGRIWLDSTPGQGTIIYFTLPLTQPNNMEVSP